MSRAQTILEGVRLTAAADIPALTQLLSASRNLKLEHVLRILLTYLPEGTDPETYIDLLKYLSSDTYCPESPPPQAASGNDALEQKARQKVRRLRLVPLRPPEGTAIENADPLSLFLLQQAHQIDADTGSLDLVRRLLEPFVHHSELLRTWMISTLLPILRLDYDYYTESGTTHSLYDFEQLDGSGAIQALLSEAAQRGNQEKNQIGRDLRGLVGPWMYGENMRKRRKLSHRRTRKSSIASLNGPTPGESITQGSYTSAWSYVNKWLLELALRDFPQAVNALTQWQGPTDVEYGEWGEESLPLDTSHLTEHTYQYVQVGIASVYATSTASLETIMGAHRILQQAIKLTEADEPPDLKRSDARFDSGISKDYLNSIASTSLLHHTFLDPQNTLTWPSAHAIRFLNIVLASAYKLLNLGSTRSCRDVAELILFSGEGEQKSELRKILHRLKSENLNDERWDSTRRQLLWLHNWERSVTNPSSSVRAVLSKIDATELENELLRAMLDAGCYTLPIKLYCKKDSPLPTDTVKETIIGAALSAYDAASNGNRTRGGVRKASDIYSSFRPHYPSSRRLDQISALLSATHAMSFYSLKLQHGVPFRPVNIRAHKDPMSLIGKILDQNSKSYTHLDDLLEIGQNLVSAGIGVPAPESAQSPRASDDLEQDRVIARRRVTRMAIEAALAENDFDTAYSYVVTRLSMNQTQLTEMDHAKQARARYDDISWRAAYAAGRYPTSTTGSSALRRLEQRMELLSQALLLAPPSALSELLLLWQQCETQMTGLMAQEAAEEKQLENRRERIIPGGFAGDSSPPIQKPRDSTRIAMQEEAPMGLFDVARGAAAALSKNAFPLRGGQKAPGIANKAAQGRPMSTGSMGDLSDDSNGTGEGQTRVRKRDMVSNMVTGGLASGIGWVIGAPPARQEQ